MCQSELEAETQLTVLASATHRTMQVIAAGKEA